MSLRLYELVGGGDRRFSPFCWRIRMALAHKGLEADFVPVRFIDKDIIAFSGQTRVPVLEDGETTVSDSWAIARHLEDRGGDGPSLFGDDAARQLCRFVNMWADSVLSPGIFTMIILDIFSILDPADQDYFRTTREQRFGATLEDLQEGREGRLDGFRKSLQPLRAVLDEQPFLCGARAAYADYAVFGQFQWARCTSSFRLLEEDDPVHHWRARMLGLFDGLAERAMGFPC